MSLDYLQQVQRGIDFIEANLQHEVALDEVAKHAGISQWHFQRIFKALTNETLKGYIRARRLASALDALLGTKTRILEIALAAGYESQEAFTRAFKSNFGLTPNEYRRLGDKSRFLRKVRVDANYLRHLDHGVSLAPELYEQAPLTLVGLRTSFYGVDSEKNNLAEHLPPLWAAFVSRLSEVAHAVGGMCYGVVRPSVEQPEQLEYHAAIAVSQVAQVPAGMSVVSVPGATYAKFTHHGEARNLNHTVNYVYSSWLLNSGRRHSYGADLEMYGPGYHPTAADSVIYYALPLASA